LTLPYCSSAHAKFQFILQLAVLRLVAGMLNTSTLVLACADAARSSLHNWHFNTRPTASRSILRLFHLASKGTG